MIRRWLARLLTWGEKLVDESVPASDILSYLEEALRKLEKGLRNRPQNGTERILAEIESARLSLAIIQGDAPDRPESVQTISQFLPDIHLAEEWLDRLPDGNVVVRGEIERGTGANLQALLLQSSSEADDRLSEILERLLRHVEVRREKALRVPGVDPESTWLERLDITVLFLEIAQKTGDSRFLNAAIKLNDWVYRKHRYSQISPGMSRYVYSLALQEKMMFERRGK